MSSSEIMDSGRFSGGRSNFSQTCSLLSQYLKEKGSFGDLSLGLTQNSGHKGAPTGTMNLLSMIEESGQGSGSKCFNPTESIPVGGSGATPEAETAPLTIFYGGQVIVFNDFPADKAKEIMSLASKSSATMNHTNAAFAPPVLVQSPAQSTTNIVPASFGIQEHPHGSAQPPLGSDLPIARKNSLTRFLEKRRDRITANAPYATSKPVAPPKQVQTEAWLGLAPQLPLQIQRH